MAVNLAKGQRVTLDSSLRMALVILNWDTNRYDGGHDFDLDASAFLLGANGKVLNDKDFVFYGNLNARNGAIVHQGDNLVGGGDGEMIMIDFAKIPNEVQKVAIAVTIYDSATRKQNFGQVSNASIKVAKAQNEFDYQGETVLQFDLEEEFSIETGLVICEIYRHNGDWKFNAIAAGYQGGLATICRNYGVDVQ